MEILVQIYEDTTSPLFNGSIFFTTVAGENENGKAYFNVRYLNRERQVSSYVARTEDSFYRTTLHKVMI